MPEQSSYPEVSLADLVVTTRPITYGIVQPGPDISPEGIPLIRGKDYSSGKVDASALYHVKPEIDAPYSRSKVRGGDILFSIVGYVGQSALVPDDLAGANITQTTARISIDENKADSRYVYQHLSAEHFRPQIKRFEKGSAQPGLNLSDVARLRISLPEPPVQSRIAEILSTVDEAIEQTEALIAKTQQIKAGLMYDLFIRGVTTDGQLRPAREEAPQLYKESPLGWIPKEWEFVPLGQMAEVVSGVTLGGDRRGEMVVPYLRVANVQDGYLDLSEIKTIPINRAEFQKLVLKPGDVLMNEGGDFDKLGRGTVWKGEIENCVHQNHVFRVRTNESLLRPNYLAAWSQSQYGKSYFLRSSKQSTNLASINSTQLNAFPIGLPDVDEQVRIEEAVRSASNQIESMQFDNRKLANLKRGLMADLLSGHVRPSIKGSTREAR